VLLASLEPQSACGEQHISLSPNCVLKAAAENLEKSFFSTKKVLLIAQASPRSL
jgi:hypothetical protein